MVDKDITKYLDKYTVKKDILLDSLNNSKCLISVKGRF